MVNLDKFISDSLTLRPNSMFKGGLCSCLIWGDCY